MHIAIRITTNIVLLTLAITAPWWLFAAALVAAIAYYPAFFEAFAWSFFADILFGTRGGELHSLPMLFTVGTFLVFFGARWIKARTRYSW